MAMGVESTGPVSFGGLQSGLDTNGIIEAAVKVAEQPVRHLERQQAILVAHSATYGQVSGLMQSLQAILQQMDSHTVFSHLVASSSNSEVVTATGGSSLAANSHRIEVQALASAQRSYSDPVPAVDEPGHLGQGLLQIMTSSGVAMRLDINANTTLKQVADAINDAGIGIFAATIFDGTSHRLQVTGSETGSSQSFTFDDAGLKLNLSAPQNTPQEAQDSQFKLDNFSIIHRPSNVISDVISGVTLQLHALSHEPQTIHTSVDSRAIVEQIESFVKAYNTVEASISTATHYDGVTDHAKSVGDTTLTTLKRNLQAAIGQPIMGLTDDLRALSQIGISSQKDGSLKLDTQKLTAIVNQDPQRVARLFVFDPKAQTHGVASRLQQLVRQYTTTGVGTLTVSIDGMTRRQEALQTQIGKVQANVKKYETTLRARYTRLEKDMAQIKSQNNYIEALKPQPQKR